MTIQPAGTPNWVDLGTSDLEDAKRFYTGLFGWTANVSPDPQAGGYTIFNKGDKPVAGAGPLMGEGQPTAWSTYIATDDADAVTARIEAAGGKVLVAPFDVMEHGRMAVFTDPAGTPFSVWQAGTMPGAAIFNEPGTLTWNELTTRDADGAKEFYGSVFGWRAEDTPMGAYAYTTWHLGERPIGGMMPMTGEEWGDLPPHWMIYFAVEDTDATAARAAELGGAVSVPPTDFAFGRFTVLNDPQGAVFSVIKFSQS